MRSEINILLINGHGYRTQTYKLLRLIYFYMPGAFQLSRQIPIASWPLSKL